MVMPLVNKNLPIFLFLFSALIIFSGFRPVGFDSDSTGYVSWIRTGYYISGIEPTFGLLVSFWNLFVDKDMLARMVFITYATINLFILKLALNNFTLKRTQALVLYFFLFYSMLTLTQIRAGVGSVIFFWAVHDIIHRNVFGYTLKILLAVSFHYMMAIFLPFYFLSPKKINKHFYITIVPVSMLLALFSEQLKVVVVDNILHLLPIYIESKLRSYLSQEDVSSSIYNFHFLFILIIYLLAILNVNRYKEQYFHIIFTKVLGIGLCLYLMLSFLPTLAVRVLYVIGLLTIILIPYVAGIFKQSKIVLYSLFFMAFMLFLNTNFRNGLLHFEFLF
jgi:hypothetical protein